MLKKVLWILLALIVVGAASGGGYYLYNQNKIKNETKKQLADVQKKIDQLPELEKDIFSKCMEGKSGTASDIKACEESTQKEMFTLAQDLTNIKSSLEAKLR